MGSVCKPCIQVCIYVYKSPAYTLQYSIVAKSLDSRARLPISKCHHLIYFSVPYNF